MKIFLVVLSLLFAATIDAQAPKTFAEGVLAFEKGEWKKAEDAMRATIAVNPNESAGTVSIAGSWFETYVPHYFLARALAKQGKCDAALTAFAETERQGITPAIPDFARHLRTKGGCKPQAKKTAPEKIIKEVVVPFGEDEDVPPTSTATATSTTSTIAPTSTTIVPTTTATAVAPPPAAADARETRRRLSAIVTAYLRGQYEETVRLAERPFRDPVAAAEAALFRAAARDALYRIGGETDATLRRQAENDIRTYRALRPAARPDPRVFPPRFIAMVTR